MRYEVTVEVGLDDDPAQVLRSLENIVSDLRAKHGVDSWQLHRAKELLAKPQTELDEYDKSEIKAAAAKVAKVDEAMRRRETARAALATLNYTSEHRDAKDIWEDDDNY